MIDRVFRLQVDVSVAQSWLGTEPEAQPQGKTGHHDRALTETEPSIETISEVRNHVPVTLTPPLTLPAPIYSWKSVHFSTPHTSVFRIIYYSVYFSNPYISAFRILLYSVHFSNLYISVLCTFQLSYTSVFHTLVFHIPLIFCTIQ